MGSHASTSIKINNVCNERPTWQCLAGTWCMRYPQALCVMDQRTENLDAYGLNRRDSSAVIKNRARTWACAGARLWPHSNQSLRPEAADRCRACIEVSTLVLAGWGEEAACLGLASCSRFVWAGSCAGRHLEAVIECAIKDFVADVRAEYLPRFPCSRCMHLLREHSACIRRTPAHQKLLLVFDGS